MDKISTILGVCGGSEKSRWDGQQNFCYLLGLLGLLGEKYSLDVWQNTTLGDGHTRQKLVQLLVIADSQLQMAGDDPGLLVVTGSIACQLKDLSSQVLHDCSHVHWCTSPHSLCIVSLPQMSVDSAHWELKPSTG